jgi:hypothetical protein
MHTHLEVGATLEKRPLQKPRRWDELIMLSGGD